MVKQNPSTIVLMIAVIVWATLLGGTAYSHLVFFPKFLSDLPASAVVVNGPYGLDDRVFWYLFHPLLIVSLIAALILNWKARARRNLILLSSVVYLVVLIVSQIYFVPEIVLFRSSPQSTVPASEWLARGRRWQVLSWVRGFIMYCAFVPLLFALKKPTYDSSKLIS
jgi:hypothetical protein